MTKAIKPTGNRLINAGFTITYGARGYKLTLDNKLVTEYYNPNLPLGLIRNVELFRLIVLGIAEIELNNLLEKAE